ncbi:retrovirus-related pol polyprotein from transposon TNT 1-94 [Tanacetum coccineum]
MVSPSQIQHSITKGVGSLFGPLSFAPVLAGGLLGFMSHIASTQFFSNLTDGGTIHMDSVIQRRLAFELTAFSDADHAGCVDTRKCTFGETQFLGDKLVSWMSKKQDCTAMSSAEVEYDALSASCAQSNHKQYHATPCSTPVPSTSILEDPMLWLETLSRYFLESPDHRIHKDGDGDASFQLKSDSLPHAHAHSTKTFYKHQDSRIMKAQELKTKTSANSDINDNSSEIKLRGRLLESFQDDAKYEHVVKNSRSQGGKDVKDKQG